jgi:hypothetical protein
MEKWEDGEEKEQARSPGQVNGTAIRGAVRRGSEAVADQGGRKGGILAGL